MTDHMKGTAMAPRTAQLSAWSEEEESAMLLGSIYGDLAGLMQEDAPAPTEPIHFNPFFDHFCHCGH